MLKPLLTAAVATFLTVLVIATLGCGAAQAASALLPQQCAARIAPLKSVVWRGDTSRGYDPFSPTRHIEPFSVAVTHDGGACTTFLVIQSPLSERWLRLHSGGDDLKVSVLDATSGRDVVSADPMGGPTSRIVVPLAQSQSQRETMLYLVIPSGQIVRGGHYDGPLSVYLYADSEGGPILLDQTSTSVSVDVPPQVQAGFDDIDGPRSTTLDFGALETGETRNATIAVRSNMDFEVEMSSANGGHMAHLRSDGRFVIPYTTRINGRRVVLSTAPAVVMRQRFDHRFTTRTLDVSVEIGTVDTKAAAGEYQDIITVTLRTTD